MVLQLLRRHCYSGERYYDLGLYLGLSPATLDGITRNNKGDIESYLRECLTKWLQETDDVQEKGGPTIYSLISALRGIGEKRIANGIDMESKFNKNEYCILYQVILEGVEFWRIPRSCAIDHDYRQDFGKVMRCAKRATNFLDHAPFGRSHVFRLCPLAMPLIMVQNGWFYWPSKRQIRQHFFPSKSPASIHLFIYLFIYLLFSASCL